MLVASIAAGGCRTRLGGFDENSVGGADLAASPPLPACAGFRSTSGWSTYRAGGRHTGRSPHLGPQSGTVKWKLDVGAKPLWMSSPVNDSPVLGLDGTIYIGSPDSTLYTVGPSGTIQWSFPTGGLIWSSPAVGPDGTVYIVSEAQGLTALDQGGNVKWRQPKAYGTPVVAGDGTVYVGATAFEGVTGAPRWSVPVDGVGVGSAAAIGDDCTVFVGGNRVYALDHLDGTIKWMSDSLGQAPNNSPVIGDDGTVFMGAGDRALYALDGATGRTLWKHQTTAQIRADPALGPDGTVYFSSEEAPGRNITALDPKTGEVHWTFSVAQYSIASSAVVGSDNTIYFGTGSGVRLFALDGASGNTRWTSDITTDEFISPAIGADGTLYYFASGVLTAIGAEVFEMSTNRIAQEAELTYLIVGVATGTSSSRQF